MYNRSLKYTSKNAGYTIIELLVSMLLGATLMASISSLYVQTAYTSFDSETISVTEDSARSVLDIIAFDIRMLGSGVPLNQSDFAIGQSGLGDSPLPILTDSSSSSIHFRLNETGDITQLTADYIPDSSNLSFNVSSTDNLYIGDTIYINDATTGGSDGLKGEITNINNLTITIKSDYITSPDSIFPSGSEVQRVAEVTFTSPSTPSTSQGVKRNNGTSNLILANNTVVEFKYLKENGDNISLPLSENKIKNDLAKISVTVQAFSNKKLKDGTTYTAEAKQVIALRNLHLF